MTYYLIDYENVKTHGLDGISGLGREDSVCLFYSENADTLTFGLHRRLSEAKAEIQYQKVETGTKNALDFQLSSYLGYLISENRDRNARFYIVTKDKGFGALVSYWSRRDVPVKIVMDLAGRDEDKEKDELNDQVSKVVNDKTAVPTVVKIIQQYKTKQGINNALLKEFKDNKRASEIYTAIKPLITDKKGRQ